MGGGGVHSSCNVKARPFPEKCRGASSTVQRYCETSKRASNILALWMDALQKKILKSASSCQFI